MSKKRLNAVFTGLAILVLSFTTFAESELETVPSLMEIAQSFVQSETSQCIPHKSTLIERVNYVECLGDKQLREMLKLNHGALAASFDSQNPEDWAETDGQFQAGYVSALYKYQELLNGPNESLKLISIPEHYSFFAYTRFIFSPINRMLFKYQTFSQAIDDLIKNLESNTSDTTVKTIPSLMGGLKKAPVFQGTVYRSAFSTASTDQSIAMEKAKEHFNEFAVTGSQNEEDLGKKQKYIFNGFMSTTKGIGTMPYQEYVVGAKLLLVIESKKGRDLELLSQTPEEEEVLFLPFSEFNITKKEVVRSSDGTVLQYKMFLSEL